MVCETVSKDGSGKKSCVTSSSSASSLFLLSSSSCEPHPPPPPVTSSFRIPIDAAVTFYFSIFLSDSTTIFHSNNLPAWNERPPYSLGDVVYFGPAEQVAQQKLQYFAFPSVFSSKGAATQEVPPWRLCVESVQTMSGLRCQRLIVTSTFVVLVEGAVNETGTMHTKHVAIALVITCPPDKPYGELLLQNFDGVVLNMLYNSLDFAMPLTQLFFQKISPSEREETLVAKLERLPVALKTYFTLGAILVNTLTPHYTIPRINSRTDTLSIALPLHFISAPPESARCTVDGLLHYAIQQLRRFGEDFINRVICGLLSLSNWESYGISCGENNTRLQPSLDGFTNDIYGDYWKEMEKKHDGCSDVISPSPKSDRRTDFRVSASSSQHVRRVVIFCEDEDVAWCLLVVASFFFRNRRGAENRIHSQLDSTPFAGKVNSYAHPSLPVQCVMEEYDRTRVDPLLCSALILKNEVLVIAPRTLVCRRLCIVKSYISNLVVVERWNRSTRLKHPFETLSSTEIDVVPHPLVRLMLDAAQLYGANFLMAGYSRFLEWLMVQIAQNCSEESILVHQKEKFACR